MKLTYKHTILACFVGYIVQAIVNNFVPLLFVLFQNAYGIPLNRITLLITFNFVVQILTDLVAAKYVDKIGYRAAMILAHLCAALGLGGLTVLPEIMDPFGGILIAVMIYAIGGGLLEVLVSPVMESCPTDNKEAAMSLLHSFYCWGHVGVVLISTVFFSLVGIENWKLLAAFWALIPVCNGLVFFRTPMASLMEEGETGMTFGQLFRNRTFWWLLIMMICSGASEHSVAEWASAFAEQGLGISKTLGDLAGPMSFAVCMGISRVIYGNYGEKIPLEKYMKGSALLCVGAYLLISLSPWPALSLVGCAVCGVSVGIMWPGTFSTAAASLRTGGTAMFGLLALAGDVGCGGGPTLVGMVSDALNGNLKLGILAGILFPVVMAVCLFSRKRGEEGK